MTHKAQWRRLHLTPDVRSFVLSGDLSNKPLQWLVRWRTVQDETANWALGVLRRTAAPPLVKN